MRRLKRLLNKFKPEHERLIDVQWKELNDLSSTTHFMKKACLIISVTSFFRQTTEYMRNITEFVHGASS